jgi:hypothetical protein
MWTTAPCVRARMLSHFSRKCLGFIFFDFFSNLNHTGCRRGRTPERPLRQPSRVWQRQAFLHVWRQPETCGRFAHVLWLKSWESEPRVNLS